MDSIINELGISVKNVKATNKDDTFVAIVTHSWLKKLMKCKLEYDTKNVNAFKGTWQINDNVSPPWSKVFIRVFHKRSGKVFPLPRSKLGNDKSNGPLSFSQILSYVSQTNHRNLWKESYKKHSTDMHAQSSKELSTVNVLEYNSLLNEIILRLYGCNVIKIKHDPNDPTVRTSEIISGKNPSKIYDSQSNIMPVICAVDTDDCIFLVHHFHYNHTLSDCIFFSPALLDLNYSRCLFLLYQLLHVMRFLYNRGLNLGEIKLDDIFINESLWIQISPQILSNLNVVNPETISEHTKLKSSVSIDQFQLNCSKKVKTTFDVPTVHSKRDMSRNDFVTLEKLCNLWVRGCLSNLDYLIHLNQLAGRRAGDPDAHHVVPWVTDFTSRCGKQWRDLTKSKYRLTKGDRQLDMTYDVLGKETLGSHGGPHQIPHHVSDVLSDITYYVYMARRTSKELLCKNVRNNWVPAEYPSSIQRMQQWTPDECIPEFFTDSTVFKSIHEDLPDLEIPAWATCIEDFITKHREALESVQVSESLHHWIDLTFGYKLSGSAAVKAKNVCLSLVDGHTDLTRSGPVQLFSSPHPARLSQTAQCWGEKLPPRIYWQKEKRKTSRHNQESSDEFSADNDDDLPQNVSNLSIPQPYRHSSSTRRKGSVSRTRRHNRKEEDAQTLASPTRSIAAEIKNISSTPHHFKVQKSELGKTPYYLPKEYNPLSHLQVGESLHVFKVKTFYKNKENEQTVNETDQSIPNSNNLFSNNDLRHIPNIRHTDNNLHSDENSFTNQMFVASYEHNYLRRHKSENKEVFKEIKDRCFNTRLVTNSATFKHLVLSHRKKDMQVFGCLIVEIFLNHKVRPFQSQAAISFDERYKVCRLVLRNNLNVLPKCVKYVACCLLQVNESDVSSEYATQSPGDVNFPSIQKNGLPSPSAVQLLQPLLSNFLIPFPSHFALLYSVVSILHEYSVSERESNILYSFECDGQNCSKFQHLDKTKLYFSQRIAEAKVYSCSVHLENLYTQMNSFSQFDSMDLFLPHFVELLTNKTTSILAAWYLFDPVSKALGPNASINKLLPLILNLYDEHSTEKTDDNLKSCKFETSYNITAYNNKKSVKLYHHIFLLQLIVRFGLQCFLENFVPHLVEAVGGYKDNPISDSSGHTHSTNAQMKSANSLKKLTYCEEKPESSNLSTDVLSPDTSCGSENTLTPCIERDGNPVNDAFRKPRCVSAVESEVFHFETDSIKETSTSKSDVPSDDTKSWDSSIFNKSNIKCLIEEIDCVSNSANIEKYLDHSQAVEATESVCGVNRDETKDEDASQNTINEICFHENTYGSNNASPTNKSPVGRPGVASPTIPIPSYANGSFTSYVQRIDNENDVSPEICNEGNTVSKSLDFSKTKNDERGRKGKLKMVPNHQLNLSSSKDYKISEMSSESLIWLAHRLGPVLTCKYLTRNLLKMLTLCYIGKENLMILKGDESARTFSRLDTLCVVNGTLVGDCNATKVIDCLTSIVALYGEQITLLQYFPHMGDLIASCKRRTSAPLEGGLIACFQLLRHLIPYISDGKLMEQLRDIILKNILQPTVKLISSTRSTFPSGHVARAALARKFVETMYVIALRIGPEMTKTHLCDTVLPRFFMTFEKVNNKEEDSRITDSTINTSNPQVDMISQELDDNPSSLEEGGSYLEICRDGSTAEWKVRGGEVKPKISIKMGEPSGSSPDVVENTTMSALEELQTVFHAELAHHSYMSFVNFVGEEAMDRCVKNSNTLKKLCQEYDNMKGTTSISSAQNMRPSDYSPDEVFSRKALNETNPVKIGMDVHLGRSDSIPCKSNTSTDDVPASSSFSSNVAIVGNRIDVQTDLESDICNTSGFNYNEALDIVSCKIENGMRSSRHLRGDWLMYWEHEIGRSDKDAQFNLKQIKLQTFAGHTHSVRNIVCLDNENSFMSGSKDKTVKLWSLRNQGDGSFTSSCQWTYTGHRKGILSLTFLDSLRLSISTDAYVHIWDPYVENFIAQLDHCKSAPVSIVKAMPAPSSVVLAATTDTVLKLIDARNCSFIHELKVTFNPNTFIRCICVSPSGKWVAVGLATGHLSLLDLRTGALIAHWKGHDGEILQLVTINETSIVSSSLDQTMWVWSTIDGKPRFQLKGSTEPVHCLSTYHSELISGTTNNRIGVHTGIDRNATFSSTKLRSDTFKGVLTSMGVLSLNRMLLLGSESGNISLLC